MRPRSPWSVPFRPRVTVWLVGRRGEHALGTALARGVEIHAVRSLRRDVLEIDLSAGMLRPLRHAVRGLARVQVRRRRGGPYLMRQAVRRPGLWLGAIGFALALGILGSLVWQVRVEGVPMRLAHRLLAAAQSQGIRPGVPRGWVESDRAAHLLERAVAGVTWVGVQLDGGLVTIRAVPSVQARAGEGAGRWLVAGHGGRVVAVHVRQGVAEVAAGQHVAAGQVLVRGYMAAGGTLADGAPAPPHWVAPRATITARWHATGQAQASGIEVVAVARRPQLRWMAAVDGRTLGQGGPTPSTSLQRRQVLVRWRIRLWGIEWIALKVERVAQSTRLVRRLPRSTAVAAALLGAERDMLRKTGGDVRVVSRSVQTRWQGTRVRVLVQAEVEGDIARPVGSVPGG